MKKQVLNPYLPLDTYIPDGEPHVFDNRLYLYGSHDREGGDAFCLLDYEVWSAPVDDLSDWRCEGISYRADQDPMYGKPNRQMYAPDVARGSDGRYYLYYAMAGTTFTSPIHVAVSDSPAGPFDYYGEVHHADGTPYQRHVTFDPGVLNDQGSIYLYYGWALGVSEGKLQGMAALMGGMHSLAFQEKMIQVQEMLFGKSREEIEHEKDGLMGANVVRLASDMLTVVSEPKRIVPGQFDASGTEFEGHAFFEASSIRKIRNHYYFIYSSQKSHELCYAVSNFPDRDFHYGGVLISNGDIGYHGRKEEDRLALTGNNHGSIVCVNGQWYVFYHRQTHKTSFSRQGCAEKIQIKEDGSIAQVEMTSCGLNDGPLQTEGTYSAVIACNLTNGHMPHMDVKPFQDPIPHVTNEGEERFLTEIMDHTSMVYKYFIFSGECDLEVRIRGNAEGILHVYIGNEEAARMVITSCKEWSKVSAHIRAEGIQVLTFRYEGTGMLEIRDFSFLHV